MKTYGELKALIEQRGVHQVFGELGEGYFIEQNAAELAEFLVEMQALGVQSVLEIGTGYKAGLARFLHDEMGWAITSVDIQDYGHQYESITFIHAYLGFDTASIGQFDLVIIDADHSYGSVKADDDWWRSHATKVIAFHDIAGLRECEGVAEYWHEIAYQSGEPLHNGLWEHLTTHPKPGYHELIADSDQRGGIGYIVLAETLKAFEDELATMPDVDLPELPLPPTVKKPTTPRKRTPAKKAAARTTKR